MNPESFFIFLFSTYLWKNIEVGRMEKTMLAIEVAAGFFRVRSKA